MLYLFNLNWNKSITYGFISLVEGSFYDMKRSIFQNHTAMWRHEQKFVVVFLLFWNISLFLPTTNVTTSWYLYYRQLVTIFQIFDFGAPIVTRPFFCVRFLAARFRLMYYASIFVLITPITCNLAFFVYVIADIVLYYYSPVPLSSK